MLEQGRLRGLLFPDADGVPTLASTSPLVVRGVYLGASELETHLANSHLFLNDKPGLLVGISSPEGPPYRSCLYYTHQGQISTPWRDETRNYHGHILTYYAVTTVRGPWQWLSEYAAGQPGYFVTGSDESSSLWRVFRLEADAFGQCLFTLAPVRFTSRLPSADFSNLGAIATELEGQYRELCGSVVQGAYRDVVTKAKNIVEGILATQFKIQSRDRLHDSLQRMKAILEEKRESVGYTDLQYHVAQKIRLAHARTHATADRPLTPEFALGVIDDLAFLLTEWGLTSPTTL